MQCSVGHRMPDKILNSRKIVKLRELKGWTQKRLADETERRDPELQGVSLKTVQNAESRKPCSPRTQALLALALGVKPGQLDIRYELRLVTPYVAAGSLAFVLVVLFIFHRAAPDDPILIPSGGIPKGITSDIDYRSGPSMAIDGVRVSADRFGYSMTISGSGFGKFPYPLPFHGDTAFLRIENPSHRFESAYLDDKFAVRYLAWTDRKIEIGDIAFRTPGDDLEIGIWNPQTGRAAAWAGNIPPLAPGTPRVASASFAYRAARLQIRLTGIGFGDLPPGTRIAAGPYLVVGDLRYHDFIFHTGARSVGFTAGNDGGDPLTLFVWRDREIDISLPTVAQKSAGRVGVHPGDPICIFVMNPTTKGMVSWSGRVPSTLAPQSDWITAFNPSAAIVEASIRPENSNPHGN